MKGLFRRITFSAAAIASVAFLLSGCSDGSNGSNGINGANGANGLNSNLGVVDAGKLTTTDLQTIALGGKITSASIPGNRPVVKFQVYNKSNGQGIVGLRTFSLHIAQLKPEVAGSSSYWQNYIAAGLPLTAIPAYTERNATTQTAPVNPSADAVTVYNADGSVKAQGYTVVDNLDGSYTATFGADIKANTNVPYDASLVHRIAIGVRSIAVPGVVGKTPGAYAGPIAQENIGGITAGSVMSSFTNTNGTALVYDFYPNTGASVKDAGGNDAFARDIVTIAACNQCHGRLEYGSNNTSGHFGSRPDTKVCVVCHTPQLSAIAAYGEGDFITLIHKIHMGSRLPVAETAPLTTTGVDVSKFTLPMDPRNCTVCHKGADADNWKTKANRKSCGSCHTNITFATGANSNTTFASGIAAHPVMADDATCATTCHPGTYVAIKHATEYVTPNNLLTPTGLVNFKYDIKSVTVNGTNQALITFRILSDGGTGAAMTPVIFTGAGSSASTVPADAVLSGFSGSPGFLLAYNKSTTNQTFSTSPDYNNLGVKAAQPVSISIATLLNGAKGTLSARDADGYYTATINADASVPPTAPTSFPAGAKMRTVALQGYFTQTTPASGRHTLSIVKTVTGDTPRRVVIDAGKCGACHEVFEGYGGNRNIGKGTFGEPVGEAVCTLCHVPNLSSSGKGANAATVAALMTAAERALLAEDGYTLSNPTTYPEETNNFKDMIHGIHAGKSRAAPLKFVRDRGTVVLYFSAASFKFPNILKNCEACHTSTSYRSIPPNALVTTDLTTPLNADGTVVTTFDTTNNVATVSKGRTMLPNANDLVTTPFTAACVSCHDLASSKAHMIQNGGKIKVPRLSPPLNVEEKGADEACATCHGVTGTASIYFSHRF